MFAFFDQNDVDSLLESTSKGMHRTLSGRYVKIGSQACKNDIESRIEDVKHNRDNSNHGSDARSYYSGVLRVLRRKLRETDKILFAAIKESNISRNLVCDDINNQSSRLMILSGLFRP